METKKDKTIIIKELAVLAKFNEIRENYGDKAYDKALLWTRKKASEIETSDETDEKYYTPFMKKVMKDKYSSIEDIAKIFFNEESEINKFQITPSPTFDSSESDSPIKNQSSKVFNMNIESRIECNSPARDNTPTQHIDLKHNNSSTLSPKKKNKIPKNKASLDSNVVQKVNKKSKKVMKEKIEGLPKGPRGAYIFYGINTRQDIVRDHPNAKTCEILKLMGNRWQELSSEEKLIYYEMASQDKLRHADEMKEFYSLHPEKHPSLKTKPKKCVGTIQSEKKETSKKSKSNVVLNDNNNVHGDFDEDVSGSENNKPTLTRLKRSSTMALKDYSDADHEVEQSGVVTDSSKRKRTELSTNKSKSSSILSKEDRNIQSAAKGGKVKNSNSKIEKFNFNDQDVDADLKNMKQISRAKSVLPSDDYKLTPGSKIGFILPAYRDFISNLPHATKKKIASKNIQKVCSLSGEYYYGEVITATTSNGKKLDILDEEMDMEIKDIILLTIRLFVAASSDSTKSRNIEFSENESQTFCIAYALSSSELMVTDDFIVDSSVLSKSFIAPWLVVNAQVKKQFMLGSGNIGVWYEGSIYHIRQNFVTNPYRSIKVVWLVQEQGTNTWFYDYIQTDNDMSPWDLTLSSYVLSENVKAPSLPSYLVENVESGVPRLRDILKYLSDLDFSYVFKYCVSEIPEYCKLFPNSNDHIDLHHLWRQYGTECPRNFTSGEDVVQLFNDIDKMILNCKTFNNTNRSFQPWRCADMMEMAVSDLKLALLEVYNLPNLAEVVNALKEETQMRLQCDIEEL